MTERLLQYIWQFQYFNKNELTTFENEPLQIINCGTLNTNQGADFSNAKIKIGNTTWAGSIELHINSSDWKNHQHATDKNYKNVILHVVWQHNTPLQLPFATLILHDRVSKLLLANYYQLLNAKNFIPCQQSIQNVKEIIWVSWKERLLIERLQAKTDVVFDHLQKNKINWEETFWWMLAKNFGAKVNSGAFEKIAQSIPLNILAKHKNQIHQLEALLLGQAGLLQNNFTDDYSNLLQKEYQFLKAKYQLKKVEAPLFFLRMRPANFPSIRLAQLSMLIHNSVHLFSVIKESDSLKNIRSLLNVTANDYWHYHYLPDVTTTFKKKKLGIQMIDNILINTVIPIVFAYGVYHSEERFKEKSLQWLLQIAAEKNTITKGFQLLQIPNKNAFDSQSLIQLKNEYCHKKRCLDCAIGNSLLRTVD